MGARRRPTLRLVALLLIIGSAVWFVTPDRKTSAQASWCKTLDFTQNSWGFTPDFSGSGNWVSGVGWESGNFLNGDHITGIAIQLFLTSPATFTSAEYHGTLSIGGGDDYLRAGEGEAGFTWTSLAAVSYMVGTALTSGAQDIQWPSVSNYYQLTPPVVGIVPFGETLYSGDDSTSYAGGTAVIQNLIICGTGTSPPEFGGGGAPPISGYCQACNYSPTGDWATDLPALFAWLWCQLANLWGCQALPVLVFMWGVLLEILHVLAWSRIWIADEFSIFGLWCNSNVLSVTYYLSDIIQNAATEVTQAIYYTGGAHTTIIGGGGGGGTIWDVLIALITQLGQLLSNLTTGLPQAIASIVNNVAQVIIALINGILTIAFYFLSFVEWLINAALMLVNDISNVFSLIPATIDAFAQGLSNASLNSVSVGQWSTSGPIAPGTVPGALDCTDPVVYHLCLADYVLDNTVFGGNPSFATVIIQIGLGIAGINAILWAIRRFQNLKAS